MNDRKNIFLIGRRGNERDEDQLTEMLAFLWQEVPEKLVAWLASLGLLGESGAVEVETQFVLPSGKRPDIAIMAPGRCILVESKLGSGFGGTQIPDYLDYLGGLEGLRALVLLTERPESVPPDLQARSQALNVVLISNRWHDMAEHIGDSGDESLAGDFVHLLVREGLVKPTPFEADDWNAWNAGYNVLLRADAFLDELDPLVKRLDPSARRRGSPGLTKRWIYKVWRGDSFEVGLGLGAAGGFSPSSPPIIFAFVSNPNAGREDAVRAVGASLEKPGEWSYDAQRDEWCGLIYDWPCIACDAKDVLIGDSFEKQLSQAADFMRKTARHFQSRGYMPAKPPL